MSNQDSLGGADAGRFAVALVKRPGFLETADRTGERAVVLVDPVVILRYFVGQPGLFALLVGGQSFQIASIALQNGQRSGFEMIDRATQGVAGDAVADRS